MRIPRLLTIALSLFGLAIIIGTTYAALNMDRRLIKDASFSLDTITPNADGDRDITRIEYEIARNAVVSIFFTDEGGRTYYFRRDQRRSAGEYAVLFSGVVEGFVKPLENIEGLVERRLLPDGKYSWFVEATDAAGVVEKISGQITVREGDPVVPDIQGLSISPPTFTPNRDGISDRATINLYIPKAADVRVFIPGNDGVIYPISERERDVPTGEAGIHEYDYSGGVDEGATPPEDGTYQVWAVAEDDEGQRVSNTIELSIEHGGIPRADIVQADIDWSAETVVICDTLYFTLTVENYGDAPIRTTGPAPGTVYDSDWNFNTLGWHVESGAWRIAVGFDNQLFDYPYRWAVGDQSNLVQIGKYWYPPAKERATVTGGVRLVDIPARNPSYYWIGLIHEDVQISALNNRVDPLYLTIGAADMENPASCQPRTPEMKPDQ
ncbi:MAG: hypothetical protein JXA42_01410 [Anaerolineales bacterium]|nr:hypothetical protein [Anaerolineales bacterium]